LGPATSAVTLRSWHGEIPSRGLGISEPDRVKFFSIATASSAEHPTEVRSFLFLWPEPGVSFCVFLSIEEIKEAIMGRGILLWLLGVPIPVILLLWLFFGR
jgi:hypothetical protein